MAPNNNEVVILSGNTYVQLADAICSKLGMKRTELALDRAANRETLIQLPKSIRSKDVYIVQTATPHTSVNDALIEFLLMGYMCRTSAAKNLIGVMPYLPYGKQARQRKRGSIPARLIAQLISRSGFNHIVTVDLQHKETQGFFDIPVENLRASSFLINQIREMMIENQLDRNQVVIVAQHTSSVQKATGYARRLKVDLAIIHGNEANEPDADAVDGRSSPPAPTLSIDFPGGEKLPILRDYRAFRNPMTLVGDVHNKVAILVENIIDDVNKFIVTTSFLKHPDQGAKRVHLIGTHAMFSKEAAQQLNDSPIDEIVVTNTVPHEIQSTSCPKIKTIDISILLTEAIRRLHNNESLSYLFADVAVED